MRLLLDTNALLHWVADNPELGKRARKLIADPANECFVSVASAWELAIKAGLGKLRLALPVERFMAEQLAANGFRLLGIELKHVGLVETLPYHHRDPFDRLLIAQALEEKMPVVTADAIFPKYGVKKIW